MHFHENNRKENKYDLFDKNLKFIFEQIFNVMHFNKRYRQVPT